MFSNKKLFYGITVVVLVGILALSLFLQRDLFIKAAQAFKEFQLVHILIAYAAGLTQISIMATRLHWLRPRDPKPSFLSSAYAMYTGHVLNLFLPARVGDFFKIWAISPQRSGKFSLKDFSQYATGAGILLSEKLVDTVGVIISVIVSGSYNTRAFSLGSNWKTIGIVVGFIVVSAALFPMLKRIPKIQSILKDLGDGFAGIRDKKILIFVLLLSSTLWFCEGLAIKYLTLSQGYSLSWAETIFVLVALNLAISVPVTMANIGPFEAAMSGALTLFGVPLPTGVAIATLHHVIHISAAMTLAAIFGIWNRYESYKNPVAVVPAN